MTFQAATAQVGTAMRLKRVIDPAGVSVICALDHGMTSPTFLEPLADIGARTAEVGRRGQRHHDVQGHDPPRRAGLLADDLAGPAPVGLGQPGRPGPEIVQIAQVEEALRLGADAVVLFTALGGDTEAGMLGPWPGSAASARPWACR